MKSIVRVNESSIIDTQDIYRIAPDGDPDDIYFVSLAGEGAGRVKAHPAAGPRNQNLHIRICFEIIQ